MSTDEQIELFQKCIVHFHSTKVMKQTVVKFIHEFIIVMNYGIQTTKTKTLIKPKIAATN